jgi:hypothetical protein
LDLGDGMVQTLLFPVVGGVAAWFVGLSVFVTSVLSVARGWGGGAWWEGRRIGKGFRISRK